MVENLYNWLYNAKRISGMRVSMSDIRIDCKRCKHYYITWEPSNPMGCRKFGFKSRIMPSEVVYRSSGDFCKGFEEKQK